MNLNEFQQRAAYQNDKYSLIIAGAGTGKTFTLLGRIQYLIQKQHLKPEEILVISYTNETVNDFKKKSLKYLGFEVPTFTFHKLAKYLLDKANFAFRLCDEKMVDYIAEEFLFGYCYNNSLLKKLVLRCHYPFGIGSFDRLIDQGEVIKIKKMIKQFVLICSTKNYGCNEFNAFYQKVKGKDQAFLTLCFLFHTLYQSEKISQGFLDFDDLIQEGMNVIEQIKCFPFRHVLIDEFQDNSFIRISFLEKMVNHFHMHFTAVGDDCQSIYRFSGTESNCFLILSSFFPNIKRYYLKYTYRNSQELINIANAFVLKNPSQIKKDICSSLHTTQPIEILYYFSTKKIYSIIQYILQQGNQDILILSRNSFDWKYYFSGQDIYWTDKTHFHLKQFSGVTFTFMTVHQSKGLEAQNVILLHVCDALYGFPIQIKTPKCFRFIFHPDAVPFEEERRIFYVALTRTKEKVYILTSIFAPSPFVQELLKIAKKQIKTKIF